MKILIADDSAMVCDRLASILSPIEGVSVVGAAHDISGAIDRIEKLRPEVVILDICMPGGTGFEVLYKVRKMDLNPVIIMLTNYPFPQYREKCIAEGADFFFDKSTELEKVIDVCTRLGEQSDHVLSMN